MQRRHTLDAPPCTGTGRPSASTDKSYLADGGRHRQSVSTTAAQFGLTLCVVRCRCNRGTLSGRRHHRPAIRLDRQVISPGSWGAAPPICACFGSTVWSYVLCRLLQVQLRHTPGAPPCTGTGHQPRMTSPLSRMGGGTANLCLLRLHSWVLRSVSSAAGAAAAYSRGVAVHLHPTDERAAQRTVQAPPEEHRLLACFSHHEAADLSNKLPAVLIQRHRTTAVPRALPAPADSCSRAVD